MTGRLNVREDEWQDTVLELAAATGWLVAHFRPARAKADDGADRWITPVAADGKGFPDLVLVRDRVVFAELKSSRGQLRPEQRVWLDRLRDAGAEAYVWRPDDFDQVAQVLAPRRRGN